MNEIIISLDLEDAKRLARLLRQMDNEDADQLATSLGSYLGMCSATDDQDELDESLNDGETIEWCIYSMDKFNEQGVVSHDQFTVQNSEITEFEKLKFFRDLTSEERLDAFRKCGIEEKVISEITNHHREQLMLNRVIKNGHADIIRAMLADSSKTE